MGWRQRTPRLAESSSREDPASRGLRVNRRNAGRVRFLSRRKQPAQSLRGGALTYAVAVPNPRRLKMSRLRRLRARRFPLMARRFSAVVLYVPVLRSVTTNGTGDCRGNIRPISGPDSQGFFVPGGPVRNGRTCGYFGVSRMVLGLQDRGTLPASAPVFAGWDRFVQKEAQIRVGDRVDYHHLPQCCHRGVSAGSVRRLHCLPRAS